MDVCNTCFFHSRHSFRWLSLSVWLFLIEPLQQCVCPCKPTILIPVHSFHNTKFLYIYTWSILSYDLMIAVHSSSQLHSTLSSNRRWFKQTAHSTASCSHVNICLSGSRESKKKRKSAALKEKKPITFATHSKYRLIRWCANGEEKNPFNHLEPHIVLIEKPTKHTRCSTWNEPNDEGKKNAYSNHMRCRNKNQCDMNIELKYKTEIACKSK